MQINLRHQEVKVRRSNSHLYEGKEKFTGAVTYSVVGYIDDQRVRHSLATADERVAVRRVAKLEQALEEGASSLLWIELHGVLSAATFKFFAGRVGYAGIQPSPTAKATWGDLTTAFEAEMQRLIDNKNRGASSEEGTMAESTRDRYRYTIRDFGAFLENPHTPLDSINGGTIARFKLDRHKKIVELKQARGGSSVALDVVILHRIFAFAIEQKMTTQQPINLSKESKPGRNPKNGARTFTGEELTKLRDAAGKDLFMFLVLRWTGLRGSDAINFKWENVHFGRGRNGEIEVVTQKRNKLAIIPLSTELRNALEAAYDERKPQSEDKVLFNPETGAAFSSRIVLIERCKALGRRAGVRRVTPHCFRDTFACDMLARGVGVFEVAKMLADTVDTVERHYAAFVPAAREAVQVKMDSGVGIEEQAKIAAQRGKKVVGIR